MIQYGLRNDMMIMTDTTAPARRLHACRSSHTLYLFFACRSSLSRCFHIGFRIRMGTLGQHWNKLSFIFHRSRVRFFCPRVVAITHDSASGANWALMALSTAWRRTFSGTFSQYTSSFVPWILSIVIGLSS